MSNAKEFNFDDIMSFELRFRAHFINSLLGFKSIGLIGTKNNFNQSNLAVFSSLLHIGANPPLVAFISRPDVAERHTLENILDTGFYTINQINESNYIQAHQTSARYDRNESEFNAVGLTEEYKNNFIAPFVKESYIQIAMEFKEKIDLTINNTILVIGLIKSVSLPENCINADGFIDLEKSNSLTVSGLDSYHKTEKLKRLTYAKVGKELNEIVN